MCDSSPQRRAIETGVDAGVQHILVCDSSPQRRAIETAMLKTSRKVLPTCDSSPQRRAIETFMLCPWWATSVRQQPSAEGY